MGNTEKINIQTYFNKGTFVIPEYQRGYKWSVKENDKESSLEYFVKSLKTAFENKLNEYFIEAVTVVEKEGEIIIVDGQQRTTSLFLLFSVLNDKHFVQNKLKYAVREDSHNWLNNKVSDEQVAKDDEDIQDIFYFKEAIKQINSLTNDDLTNDDFKPNFLKFIKNKVHLLYNIIPENKAVNTFISLNGLKAIMKDEELIKSDLLIKSSRLEKTKNNTDDKESQYGIEWKTNEDRGRLARNWDKWLYWWNSKDVKKYFGTGNRQHPLYYLLVTYWSIKSNTSSKKEFSFDNFKSEFITDSKTGKLHFEGLRKLQKTFEDLYNNWENYNLLGLSLNTNINKSEVLEFFIQNREKRDELKRFTKWSLVGCTLDEIITGKSEKYDERKSETKSLLEEKSLYESEGKNQAYLQLLRMNVLAMNKRKFDFEVFATKSLEHICPQNPDGNDEEFHKTQNEIEEREGLHSIGNLVLLNGSANSSLSNHPFVKKKELLFDKIKDGFLLPHTLKVFSKSFATDNDDSGVKNLFNNEKYWLVENVEANKNYFLNEFDGYYGK